MFTTGWAKPILRAASFTALFGIFLLGTTAQAQVAGGTLVGAVLDPNGAAVAGAKVTVENLATGVIGNAVSEKLGQYRFDNLLVGSYKVTVVATGFRPASRTGVAVVLSTANTANIALELGSTTDSVTVSESDTLIETISAQIGNILSTRMLTDLQSASNPAGGYLNLALLGAGVGSSGGVGAGTGPSIGGQRPRNNNFTIEGVDNNRKDVTGPLAGISNDAIAEFTVLQNQFSAEYGHSSGGQFNAVLRSGSNQYHGKAYEYFQNRYLNAQDEIYKRQRISDRQRFDQNTVGGNLGGPVSKDRLFFFGGFDYSPSGRASTTSAPFWVPTVAGFNTLALMPNVSQTNVASLKQYVGAAQAQDGTKTAVVQGVSIPLGQVPIISPVYQNTFRAVGSVDFNSSDRDQWRGRFVNSRAAGLDTASQLSAFWTTRPVNANLATIAETHVFSPHILNEVRVGYNRYLDSRMTPQVSFPGLDAFPYIVLKGELNLQLGPSINSPQAVTQNTYQLVDNLTWNKGNHDLKFGFDGRDAISSVDFVSGIRGDYEYANLDRYLSDLVPNSVALRNTGGKPYRGNANAFYVFANDNWKVVHNLTVNLGLRWEYNGISKSMKEFALNSIADVPGVLTFFAPKPQMKNFAPRVGFAYSPGRNGRISIRGGFGIAYDQIFDNIGNNVRPPQAISTVNLLSSNAPAFLASGGILSSAPGDTFTVDQLRNKTSGWLPNQKLGYAINWNFGIQKVFGKDYVVDVRYLGTRGVHLLLQTQLNRLAIVTPTNSLPTYLAQPSAAELNALPLTLNQLTAQRTASGNPFAAYGFTSPITSYGPQGNSIYHGLAVDITKRLSRQWMFKTGYTWSHLMDDSTMEINFTSLSPRRPQDFGNIRSEWASSALDRRQRLTFTSQWDTPWFRTDRNWFLRTVVGNYSFSGTYTAESPQYVTPQSAIDSNLNTDSAGDRVIVNTAGTAGVGSGVTSLKNSAGLIVAYLASNPNARFIQAGQGAYANGGRNLMPTQGINNVDLSVVKVFHVGETRRIEVRADFNNALNHAQFVPGQINNVLPTPHVGETSYLTPGNALFGQWNRVFPSNARNIQLVAKFSW
ncbi:MAG: carboxypeptidase regulatory-like domain-containing protein [Acidobacteriota bacterium]